MSDIQTTGGLLHQSDVDAIYETIADVFSCRKDEITDLKPLQKGITNSVLSFTCRGGKYVYRYPGTGSEILVDRGREAMLQSLASEIGIDSTLVATSIAYGWRIARYVPSRAFDYKNISDVVRGVQTLRKLHEAPVKVRWEFDVQKKWEQLRDMIPEEKYGDNFAEYPGFSAIRDRVYKLYELSKNDNISKCLSHGDSRDENFLINENEIYLIDWEYAGYGDPGFDIGTYVAGGDHSQEEVDQILFIYFRREPTPLEKRHFYAWIAMSGFFYMHWCMFKESTGQKVGYLKPLWYRFAKEYSSLALDMYKEGI